MNVEIEFENYNIKSPKMPDPFNVNLINAVGSGGGGGGNEVELTWAEYEALSEAEKMNGTNYFITDINTTKSLTKKTLLSSCKPTANTTYTLSDSVFNYDYIVVNTYWTSLGNGQNGTGIIFSDNLVIGNNSSYTVVPSGSRNIDFKILTDTTIIITNAEDVSGYSWEITGYIYQRVVVPNQMINYSTIETKIGTWIDGKPLYQKTIIFDSQITISETNWTLLPNTQDLYNVVASIIMAIGYGIINNYYGATRVLEVTRDPNLGTNGLYALSCRKNQDYIKAITLQYTKTTD